MTIPSSGDEAPRPTRGWNVSDERTRHIVMFSGGVGSWAAAKRVAKEHGTGAMTLLFADTLIEDVDLYRFLDQAAANVGAPLVRIADGRTPWDVFRDERFLGNARVGLCSRILKQQQVDAWLDVHCVPGKTIVYVGLDWMEGHRLERDGTTERPCATRPTSTS